MFVQSTCRCGPRYMFSKNVDGERREVCAWADLLPCENNRGGALETPSRSRYASCEASVYLSFMSSFQTVVRMISPCPCPSDHSSQVSEQSRGLRQKACRDGGLVADVSRYGAWARKALLAHGATRAGTAATHGHEHGGGGRSSRAGLLTRAQGGASYARSAKKQSTAAQPRTPCWARVCCAARRFI